MDANGLSVLWYMRSKPVGKVRRRVQDLRSPSSFYSDPLASKSAPDLSHNESVRLAADSLLSQGLVGYQEVLNAEGEVDFLSEQEKNYILANSRDGNTAADAGTADDDDDELERFSVDSQSPTRCPAVSTDSDPSVQGLDLGSLNGVERRDPALAQPSVEVYFQSDSRAASVKDLVREFIRKASTALAIVMDTFSDVELLCDLLEASRKRNVSVHLLLDHLNLNLFLSMWQELNLNSKHFPKLSVRSVDGQTYCAKTGKKLTGQITERFIITDWNEVLTGSYSFSWLSWQIHRGLAVLFKGSTVTPFHQEFQRLYTSSKPVPAFFPGPHHPPPPPHPLTSHTVQKDPSGIGSSRPSQTTTICHWTVSEERQPVDALNTQTQAKTPADVQHTAPGLSEPQSTELEYSRTGIVHSTQPVYQTQTHTKPLVQTQIQTQMHPKLLVQTQSPLGTPGTSTLRILQNISVENPRRTACGLSTQQAQTNLEPLEQNRNQTQAQPKPLAQTPNRIQSYLKPLGRTQAPYLQSRFSGLTITTAEKTVKVQDIRSQSTSKTNSNLHVPAHHDMGTAGLFSQERSRNSRLIKGSGTAVGPNITRGQQNCSRTFIPQIDLLLTNSQVLSSSASQQKQTKAGSPCPFTHLRGHTSGLETQVSSLRTRQAQLQRHLQSPLQSHPKVESPDPKSSSARTGTNLKSQLQLQPDSKLFSPGLGTNLYLQPHTSRPFTPPPRLHWMPQRHAAGLTPVVRQRSFSTAYGTGQKAGGQLGCRPFQSSMMMSLGRSNSLTDRHSALLKGSVLNLNITKT